MHIAKNNREDIRGTMLATDMEVHNHCRLRYCRTAHVYVGNKTCAGGAGGAKFDRERVSVGICEYIRDELVGGTSSVSRMPRYGVNVSDTYSLYEEVYGTLPGKLDRYREDITNVYNKTIAPPTDPGSYLILIADDASKTSGYFFCLHSSQQNAVLRLGRQEVLRK